MWKTWLLSSLVSAIVVGFMFGTYSVLSVYGVVLRVLLSLTPIAGIASSILAGIAQQFVLKRSSLSLFDSQQSLIGWMICQGIAWTLLTLIIGFSSLLAWGAYGQTASLLSSMALIAAIAGTMIGLILGGVQLLFWRRKLRPSLLWLALSWLGWLASAGLFAVATSVPYFLGGLDGWNGTLVLLASVVLGMTIAWFAQSAIAGFCFVPAFRNRSSTNYNQD